MSSAQPFDLATSIADIVSEEAFFDELLADRADSAGAPHDLLNVARLVRRARGAADPFELAGEKRTVAAMVAAFHNAAPAPARARRRAVRVSRRVAALGAAGALLASGVAAAATGSLPTPAQSAASSMLERVGITIRGSDKPDEAGTSPATEPDQPEGSPIDGATPTTRPADNARTGQLDDRGKPDDAGKPARPGNSNDAPGHTGDNDPDKRASNPAGNDATGNARARR